jgi:hypothetical protein
MYEQCSNLWTFLESLNRELERTNLLAFGLASVEDSGCKVHRVLGVIG